MAEDERRGNHDSIVLYIPVAPLCEQNAGHLRPQTAVFLNGTAPVDFPGEVGKSKHICRSSLKDIHGDALPSMGLVPFVHGPGATQTQLEVYNSANKALSHADPFGVIVLKEMKPAYP
ncbi:hypothetical protein BOTCAL_0338g00070 [Botryotinia calthae]|uniref:Uncharacterized protein n=1 Tax=Botryotinia calthae TaxID=38488 RepID=A0A4Y8CVL8_9HELO|nr:hypothetical protein BOTCAL_0338g00070 [Botryotinia calthae]